MIRLSSWSGCIVLAAALALVAGVLGCSSPAGSPYSGTNGTDSGAGSGKPVLTLKGGSK
jgi:hypothetical protein